MLLTCEGFCLFVLGEGSFFVHIANTDRIFFLCIVQKPFGIFLFFIFFKSFFFCTGVIPAIPLVRDPCSGQILLSKQNCVQT